MDYYKCENCGKMFDEFEMNYRAAQVDKKCWCRACREAAQQPVAVDVANVAPCKHTFDGLYCIHCGEALF